MGDILDKSKIGSIASDEHNKLVLKCQENNWLKAGGFAWQDDPYLEEYPYSFAHLEGIENLREFFRHGNWAIRQGVIYDDLVFIQQDDGGDEWWTLKRERDGYVDFESWSFRRIAEDPVRFSRAITSMQMASSKQCEKQQYMLNDGNINWSCKRSNDGFRTFSAKSESLVFTVREQSNGTCFATVKQASIPYRILMQTDGASALDVVRRVEEALPQIRTFETDDPYEAAIESFREWQATSLPEGWRWTEFGDGSGHLSSPNGESVCSFDKQTREFNDPYGGYHIYEEFSYEDIERQVAALDYSAVDDRMRQLVRKTDEACIASRALTENKDEQSIFETQR